MKKGDFVKIDFVGKVAITDEIFDLTNEELAKKEGIHNDKQKYGPVLIIVGAGMTVPGVEKQLEEMKSGEEKEFNVKPSEAFGHRRPELMKVVSMAKFIKEKINPVPGMFVTIDGREAKIQSVSGGRIRIDFNHPLASRELHYKLKIVEVIEKTLNKVNAITDHFTLKCESELKEGNLSIKVEKKMPPVLEKLIEQWIKKWIPEVKKIIFKSKEDKKSKEEPKASLKSENK